MRKTITRAGVFWVWCGRLSLIVALITSTAIEAQSLSLERVEAPPEGFETLQVPQTAWVDVFINQSALSTQPVRYDEKTLRFKKPAAMFQALLTSGLIKNHVDITRSLSEALANALETHQSARCPPQATPSTNGRRCGFIETQSLALIFDEANLRVDLFMNPQFLRAQRSVKQATYLAPAFDRRSGISHLQLKSRQAANSRDWQHTLQTQTTLALDQQRIELHTHYHSERGWSLPHAIWLHTQKNHRWQLGRFAPESSFIESGLPSLVGVRLETDLSRRLDKDQLSTAALSVFLARRARVEVHVKNRLYHQADYPAGQQIIDTQSLPFGSYLADITLTDAVEGQRQLQRWITKSYALPPVGMPQYVIEFGCQSEPKAHQSVAHCQRQRLINTALRLRLGKRWGARLGFSHHQRHNVLGLNVQQVAARYTLTHTSALSEAHAKLGLSLSRNWGKALNGLHTALSYTSVKRTRPASSPDNDETALLGKEGETLQLSLQGQLNKATYQISADWQQSAHNRTLGVTASLKYPLLDNAKQRLSLSARYTQRTNQADTDFIGLLTEQEPTKDNEAQDALLSLSLNWQLKTPKTQHSGYTRYTDQQATTRQQHTLLASQHRRHITTPAGHSLSLSLLQQYQPSQQQQQAVELDYQHPRFSLASSASQQRALSTSTPTQHDYQFSLSSHALYDAQGIHFARLDHHQSAAVLSLSHSSDDVTMQAYAEQDGRRLARVSAQQTTILGLPAYQQHTLSLNHQSRDSLTHSQTLSRSHTFYPGQFRRIHWRIERSYVLIGVLTDTQGRPISRALLRGGHHEGETDERGWFQLEVSAGQVIQATPPATNDRPSNQPCRFTPPDRQQRGLLERRYQPVLCHTGTDGDSEHEPEY